MKTTQTLLLAATLSAGLLAASGANATLVISADGKTVYDSYQNITWQTNANLGATETFGLAHGSNIGVDTILDDGNMTWGGALTWTAAMNAHNYLGYHDWRLQNFENTSLTGIYFGEWNPVLGYYASNSAPFLNLTEAMYWTGLEVSSPDSGPSAYISSAWHTAGIGIDSQFSYHKAWAVRDGQVAAVPVPTAAWLLGSGLLGLVGVARRKAA